MMVRHDAARHGEVAKDVQMRSESLRFMVVWKRLARAVLSDTWSSCTVSSALFRKVSCAVHTHLHHQAVLKVLPSGNLSTLHPYPIQARNRQPANSISLIM